jgi:Lrp/AsnC family transcriptional regulator, leucine-responsive regulatory protein
MEIDKIDRILLRDLIRDGRASLSALSDASGVSAPTVRERLRRLQDSGIITGFTVEIDPRSLGYTLEAIVRFNPLPGKLHIVEKLIKQTTRIVQCDKVTGEDCFVTRLLLRNIAELDPLLEPFADKARTSTAIVKGTPIRFQPPPLE